MSNFTFLTSNHQEFKTTYFAVDSDKIETLNVSDCYDNYGQKIDASDAGDYVILLSEKAVKAANDAYNEPYSDQDDYEYVEHISINQGFSAYDSSDAYRTVQEMKEGVDVDFIKQTVQGFTFWNGNNHKTITVSVEHGESTHSIVTDEKLIEKLNNAIENKGDGASSFGQISYVFEDVSIVNSAYATSFATYEITF